MKGILTVEQIELAAKNFYGEDVFEIEYGEGVSGESLSLFDDEKIQEIYDNNFSSSELYTHLLAVIEKEDDEEENWKAIIIIQNLDTGNKLMLLTDWEDQDNIIDYKFIDL